MQLIFLYDCYFLHFAGMLNFFVGRRNKMKRNGIIICSILLLSFINLGWGLVCPDVSAIKDKSLIKDGWQVYSVTGNAANADQVDLLSKQADKFYAAYWNPNLKFQAQCFYLGSNNELIMSVFVTQEAAGTAGVFWKSLPRTPNVLVCKQSLTDCTFK